MRIRAYSQTVTKRKQERRDSLRGYACPFCVSCLRLCKLRDLITALSVPFLVNRVLGKETHQQESQDHLSTDLYGRFASCSEEPDLSRNYVANLSNKGLFICIW